MGTQGNHEELNPRQKTFAELIADGQTATEAYLQAGYSAARRETIHRNASRLRRDLKVRAYIRHLRYEGEMIAREDAVLGIARKLDYLARIVLTGAGGLQENDELVQVHRTYKDGGTYTRVPCKLKALKLHSQLAGHFDPEPEELTPPVDTLKEFLRGIRQSGSPTSARLTAQNAADLAAIEERAIQKLYDDIRASRPRPNRPKPAPPQAPAPNKIGGVRSVAAVESIDPEGRILEEEPSSKSNDVDPATEGPATEGEPSENKNQPHQTTSCDAGRVVSPFATQMTSEPSGSHPCPIPKAQSNFFPNFKAAPQPCPYPGNDFPELYGPKVRVIR